MSTTAARALHRRAQTLRERAQRPAPVVSKHEARRRQVVDWDIIEEVLAKPAARSCRCPIGPGITRGELTDLGSGCTGGRGLGNSGFVCPTLAHLRRRIETSKD